MSNSKLSWNEIYEIWKRVCNELYEPQLIDTGFKIYEFADIPGVPENTRNHGSYLGWERIEDVEQYAKNIPVKGLSIPKWRTAHIETAKMLWENQNNPEAVALIWIGAFLIRYEKSRVCMDNLLERLNYIHFEELEHIIFDKMRELKLEIWSSATKYPVPDCLLDSHYLKGIFAPTNTIELVKLIALEISFLRIRWQLIDIRLK